MPGLNYILPNVLKVINNNNHMILFEFIHELITNNDIIYKEWKKL